MIRYCVQVKVPRLILALVLAVSILAACSTAEPVAESEETLTIAYAEPITDYSPFSYSAKDRRYLANIYDPLVRHDSAFNIDTALAVAWGRLDDTTWEFRLREGVVFHDGSTFDAEDVIYSFEYALSDPDSELASLLTGIESVESNGELRVQIKTTEPDPLLLNRLVHLYMVPSDITDFLTPNGTGPYAVTGFEDNRLLLDRYDYYWGEAPYFSNLSLLYEPSLEARYAGLLSGDIQVLANVPPQYATDLESNGVQILDFPSLETSFLFFNDSGPFNDASLRESAWSALTTDYADSLGGGYLIPSAQYAASGIMGYVSEWATEEVDLKPLETPIEVTLDLPEGIGVLGTMLAADLANANFIVTVNELSLEDFEEKIYSGQSDLYFFGWKYDLADVSEFFESVVHSEGEFNGTRYHNAEVDTLIEEAARTLDLAERRELLEATVKLYYEDKVAFPLFESKVLYGVHPSVHWDLRLDGLILASEISKNVIE